MAETHKSSKKVSDEIRTHLKTIVDHFDMEDRAVRDRQIRTWRRLKLYWDGFQKVWYSEVAHDWRIYDDQGNGENDNSSYYDKPVNVFRAYLETIIAALSIQVPPVRCSPDDAENPLDMSTAKAGNQIADLIYKHNNVVLLWLHALYVYCTEGLVACYNYTDTDEKYGTYTKKEYGDEEVTGKFCPECEGDVSEPLGSIPEMVEGIEPEPLNCPECGMELDVELEESTKTVTRLIGNKTLPKSRQRLEVYGGLYVKIPNYAMTQEQCPYLGFSHEIHYSEAIELYSDLAGLDGDWQTKVGYDAGGIYDPYERWGRLNPQYHGEYPTNTITIRKFWLRPSSYNVLDEDAEKDVRKEFPDGVCVTLANEQIACDPYEELLDDHWTLTKNPLSDYLHHDPLGLLLTSIQDITNELISLILQTVEHGIPQTFADPAVLNFDAYNQTEVAPGTIFPAKPKPGKSIGDAFYEIKTSSLSGEVLPFGQQIQNFGQLVVGALPSLFGGSAKSGSNTAAEYSMSRAQALQRLQTPWKMLSVWWKTIFSKVIPAYIDSVDEDQRHVIKDDNSEGGFINVFLRKAELEGKIGEVECESDENIPTTWTQMKDTIMALLESQNPIIQNAMASPENAALIAKAIGLDNFKVPGVADRQKQYSEISLLLNSEPIPQEGLDPQTGQPIEELGPSVPIEAEVDNNPIHIEICKAWAVSEAGIQAKQDKPDGYMNVVLHLKMHTMAEQAQQMAQLQQQLEAEGASNGEQV